MLRFNDKVVVINDEENDGFYVGFEGLLTERHKFNNTDENGMMIPKSYHIKYSVYGYGQTLIFSEEDLQKI